MNKMTFFLLLSSIGTTIYGVDTSWGSWTQKAGDELVHDVKTGWLNFKKDFDAHVKKIQRSLKKDRSQAERAAQEFATRINQEAKQINAHTQQVIAKIKASKTAQEVSELVTQQRARMLEFIKDVQSQATQQARRLHKNFQWIVDAAKDEVATALKTLDNVYHTHVVA